MTKEHLRMILLLAILMSTLSTSMGFPRIAYISNEGHDSGSGNQDSPWRTLANAVQQFKTGDKLIIEDGTYMLKQGAYLGAWGTPDNPIDIQGSGKAILDDNKLDEYASAFDTKGNTFIEFKDLHFRNLR